MLAQSAEHHCKEAAILSGLALIALKSEKDRATVTNELVKLLSSNKEAVRQRAAARQRRRGPAGLLASVAAATHPVLATVAGSRWWPRAAAALARLARGEGHGDGALRDVAADALRLVLSVGPVRAAAPLAAADRDQVCGAGADLNVDLLEDRWAVYYVRDPPPSKVKLPGGIFRPLVMGRMEDRDARDMLPNGHPLHGEL